MRDMTKVREIDGVRHCLVKDYGNQSLYRECSQPLTQSMIGSGVGLVLLFIGVIAVLGPQIDYRKSKLDSTLNRAKRSLG